MYTHRILYATHERTDADDLRELLKRGGISATVEHAANIHAARRKINERSFDLIVTDYCMEDGTGVTFCREIRSADDATPVIFYSALSRNIDIQQARDAGCDEYLVQPDDLDDVVPMICRYLGVGPLRDVGSARKRFGTRFEPGLRTAPSNGFRHSEMDNISKISKALAPVATFTAAAIFLSFAAGMLAKATRFNKRPAVGETPKAAASVTVDERAHDMEMEMLVESGRLSL